MPPRMPSRLAALGLLAALPGAWRLGAAEPEGPPAPGLVLPDLLAAPAGQARPVPPGREPVKFDLQAEGFWGTLSGKQAVQARDGAGRDDPTARQVWQSEQSWRCELVGPLALFGQAGGASEEAARKDLKLSGRTGLACQVPAPLGAELLLRGGPSLSWADPLRPEHAQAHCEMLVEVQGRLPLLAGVALEFQSSASPALSPLVRDRIQQDVRLAFPVGESGKLKLGAQRQWEGVADPRPWPDATQLYMRLELAR